MTPFLSRYRASLRVQITRGVKIPSHLQHLHVELGVVGNDDVIDVADQLPEAWSYSSLS
jgi:hypothetical protein